MRRLARRFLLVTTLTMTGVGCGSDDPDSPAGAPGGTGSVLAGAGGEASGSAGVGGSDTNGAQGGSGGTSASDGGGPSTCTPSCGDRQCGVDPVCGEPCGTCDAGLDCVSGECRSPAPLLENGDTCSTDAECASSSCGENQVGERRCYGTGEANDVCGDTFDCASGMCLQESLGANRSVCVPGISVCWDNDVSEECGECQKFCVS